MKSPKEKALESFQKQALELLEDNIDFNVSSSKNAYIIEVPSENHQFNFSWTDLKHLEICVCWNYGTPKTLMFYDDYEQGFKSTKEITGVVAYENYLGTGMTLADVCYKSTKEEHKTFCFTGLFLQSRQYLKNLIEGHGHKITGCVTKDTSFLVANEESTSSKYRKALALGVPIITEDQLKEMLSPFEEGEERKILKNLIDGLE